MGGKRTLFFPAKPWHPRFEKGGDRMKTVAVLLAAASLTLLGSNQQGDGSAESASKAVRTADASFQQAIAAKDLNKIMSFYADSAVLMPAAKPQLAGKAAVQKEWQELLSIPAFQNSSKLLRVETAGSNDLAYTMGSYETRLMGEDGKVLTEPGKWLSVWKKQPDGTWRVVVETYNTDIPPPDHQ